MKVVSGVDIVLRRLWGVVQNVGRCAELQVVRASMVTNFVGAVTWGPSAEGCCRIGVADGVNCSPGRFHVAPRAADCPEQFITLASRDGGHRTLLGASVSRSKTWPLLAKTW